MKPIYTTFALTFWLLSTSISSCCPSPFIPLGKSPRLARLDDEPPRPLAPFHPKTGQWLQPTGQAAIGNDFLFGVINDQGKHYTDEWARGIRATTLELRWDRYEPQEGLYDPAYISHMQQVLAQLNAQGWFIQLVPGYHYVPDWVFENYTDMYFVNQYGEQYDPDPTTLGSHRVINAPFNPQARALITKYIARVFQDFGAVGFDSVRVGGGVQGELRYPPPDWMGHTNSYWAFDANAQNAAISNIPDRVAAWRPGIDPNPGTHELGQMLINSGFERQYSLLPLPGWTPADEVQVELSGSSPHGGSQALKITLKAPRRVHQFVRVKANTSYEFGGWLKSGDGKGLARLIITQYDSDTRLIANAPFSKLETGDTRWSQQSGTMTTSAGAQFLKVEIDGDRPGSYYFDDLWLQQVGVTNPPSRDISVPVDFYTWYLQQLSSYQNWQISEIGKHFQGQLDLVYAGKGLSDGHLNDALSNDLLGDGWSESSRGLYAAAYYQWHIAHLETTQEATVYLTGIEDPPAGQVDDTSPYSSDWSAARWLAHLAHTHGLDIWGENSGKNDANQLHLALQRMFANEFLGLMWGFESQLYTPPDQGYATIQDYQDGIQLYANLNEIFLPLTSRSP